MILNTVSYRHMSVILIEIEDTNIKNIKYIVELFKCQVTLFNAKISIFKERIKIKKITSLNVQLKK